VTRPATDGSEEPEGGRFSPQLMFEAASMYYLDDATQAEVAQTLGTSRATVSRLLSEARRQGIVRIDVVAPTARDGQALARRTAETLGIRSVRLGPSRQVGAVGTSLSAALSLALAEVGMGAGDVLLVSSGRTVYEAAQGRLPSLPGVRVAPMVGGQDEPEPWYQTNEITRQVAAKVGGVPTFLYAPALPGPGLHERLVGDAATRRVLELWSTARCAVVGIGAPPRTRRSLPQFVPRDPGLLHLAVGDICNHFFDAAGRPTPFPGSERLLAISEEALRSLPTSIAVAAGETKVPSIRAGAKAGFFTELVTDPWTAEALLTSSGYSTGRRLIGP
jgi:DNA-binding transcriptional regulator LsrR (DeoR family)